MTTVEERIKKFNSNRLPVYTAIKYGLMKETPFVFFRGTCHLFYEDLPKLGKLPLSPLSWICGDLHVENFGSYKGDNRIVHFDITDFDEGIMAPAAWDLARITTSILIALEEAGSNHQERIKIAGMFLQTYSAILKTGKARYIEQQTATGVVRLFLDKVSERKQKDLVAKRTTEKNGRLILKIDDLKLFKLEQELKNELIVHLYEWTQTVEALRNTYKVVDVAFRIAGTGSVGINRYLFLLKKANDEKYLLIDMKQATASSLEPYCPAVQPVWNSAAERILAIQNRMQNISPALLSTTVFKKNSFIIKEMQPTEDKIQLTTMEENYEDIGNTIQALALLTASAQLRSSGRQGSASADELIEFGERSDWQKGILEYALAYAEQVKQDHKSFVKAYKGGFFS